MKRLLASSLSAGLLAVAGGLSLPQATTASTASSLAEMSCKEKDLNFNAQNDLVMMGRQVFNGVARLQTYGMNTGLIACSLAPSTGAPQFRSLNLAFGLESDSTWSRGYPVVRLKIYRDGDFYGSADIKKGKLFKSGIDVKGVRSLTLEAQCIRPSSGGYTKGCPDLWFTEDLLTE